MVHISELEWRRVDKVEDVLKPGDSITKRIKIDDQGRLDFRYVDWKPEGYVEKPRKDRNIKGKSLLKEKILIFNHLIYHADCRFRKSPHLQCMKSPEYQSSTKIGSHQSYAQLRLNVASA